jgi:hypothetical protein
VAIAKAEDALEEEGLRDLGRKLGAARKELMSLGRVLMMSQDPALVAEAHDLAGEAEEAIRAGQQKVKAALRRLGVASDMSETGSMDLPLPPRGPTVGGQAGGPNTQATGAPSPHQQAADGAPGGWCISAYMCVVVCYLLITLLCV